MEPKKERKNQRKRKEERGYLEANGQREVEDVKAEM